MPEDGSKRLWLAVLGNVLLFFIFFGLTGDVEWSGFRQKFTDGQQRKGLLAGMLGQFVILPLIGFLIVRAFHMSDIEGVTLLVVASSPGGAFSNWWSNLYNADLALSIAMTTASTALSLALLPLNTFIYVTLAFGLDVPVDITSLLLTCGIVLAAIGTGISVSTYYPKMRPAMHCVGNLAALLSFIFSVFVSSSGPKHTSIWNRSALDFYLPIIFLCTMAASLGLLLATALRLRKPERVALAIEVVYQNIAIATGAVPSMFHLPGDVALAAGVPLFYGIVSTSFVFLICNVTWKCGWTFADPHEPLWNVLLKNHQPHASQDPSEFEHEQETANPSSPTVPVLSSAYGRLHSETDSSFIPSKGTPDSDSETNGGCTIPAANGYPVGPPTQGKAPLAP